MATNSGEHCQEIIKAGEEADTFSMKGIHFFTDERYKDLCEQALMASECLKCPLATSIRGKDGRPLRGGPPPKPF